jgi:hypothetical protein
MTDTSPPAFPVGYDDKEGMSLRDWFAGQALIGVASSREWERYTDVAAHAYGLADAMLAERAKR